MIKKKAALIFIFVSNIVLLAHAVIPHHHHNFQVCFQPAHCQNNNSQTGKQNNCEGHEHDGGAGVEYCLLKQDVILPGEEEKQELKYHNLTDNHNHPYNYQILTIECRLQESDIPLFVVVVSEDDSITYPGFVNSSSGLRAPPAV